MDAFQLRTRGAGLGFVVLMHLALGYFLVTSLGVRWITRPASALVVSLLPQPRPAPPRVVPPLPLPALQKPAPLTPEMPEIAIATREPAAADPRTAPARVASAAPAGVSSAALSSVIHPPRADMAYLSNPAPAYPPLSRRLREEGRVLLRVHVDARGGVVAIEISSSSGYARLDEAALAAVRHWRFAPARAGDEPVAGWATVPISFRLDTA